MIDRIRAELKSYHACYRGCQHHEQGGEKMHRAATAIERVLDTAEALLKGDAKDHRLADALIVTIASALRML